jgi:cytoskeletal protein CcmA (bactofilin family)
MLFNKKPDNGTDYDMGDAAAKSSNGLSPFNGPHPLNLTGETLRQRSVMPGRSVIDAWLTMKGNLESEGDIQVDGKVQGHIRCSQLIVGKDAIIDGDVLAVEAVIRGKVKGVIRANRVKLQDTARVESEIIFEKLLGIEDGASFEGQISRASEPVVVAAKRNGEVADEAQRAANGTADTDAKMAAKVRAPISKPA